MQLIVPGPLRNWLPLTQTRVIRGSNYKVAGYRRRYPSMTYLNHDEALTHACQHRVQLLLIGLVQIRVPLVQE